MRKREWDFFETSHPFTLNGAYTFSIIQPEEKLKDDLFFSKWKIEFFTFLCGHDLTKNPDLMISNYKYKNIFKLNEKCFK